MKRYFLEYNVISEERFAFLKYSNRMMSYLEIINETMYNEEVYLSKAMEFKMLIWGHFRKAVGECRYMCNATAKVFCPIIVKSSARETIYTILHRSEIVA